MAVHRGDRAPGLLLPHANREAVSTLRKHDLPALRFLSDHLVKARLQSLDAVFNIGMSLIPSLLVYRRVILLGLTPLAIFQAEQVGAVREELACLVRHLDRRVGHQLLRRR